MTEAGSTAIDPVTGVAVAHYLLPVFGLHVDGDIGKPVLILA